MWQKIKCWFLEGMFTMAGMLAFLYIFYIFGFIVGLLER